METYSLLSGEVMLSLRTCLLLVVLISSILANDRHKRQLSGLTCKLPVFTEKIEATPVNPATGERTCWDSALNFTLIKPDDYAERRVEVFNLLRTICNDVCLPSIADLVKTCYASYQTGLSLACGSYGSLQCWQLPTVNTGESAYIDCYNTTETCPDDCESELRELVQLGGCCVNNVFNTTTFGSDLAGLQVASSNLWESCGMVPISFCPTPSAFVDQTATTSTYPTTASSSKFSINLVLVLIYSVIVMVV